MTYLVYLDEFGHIGPYISRSHNKHNDSPVFGLAGIILPIDQVRNFGTWFFQRKQQLLSWEIAHSGEHPATWEKKGASLYTLTNILKYPNLRSFTNRFLSKIQKVNGFVFYVGIEKTPSIETHKPNTLYRAVLRESIKRVDQLCDGIDLRPQRFILVLDEHQEREALVTAASQAMYDSGEPRRCLIEPPFQVESHRYQALQAADWVAGLVGRIAAAQVAPQEYQDWLPFRRYFESRLNQTTIRSGVRTIMPDTASRLAPSSAHADDLVGA